MTPNRPWDIVAVQLSDRYSIIPDPWLKLNYAADAIVRHRLSGFRLPDQTPEFEIAVRTSTYAYFLACSAAISDAILWDQSELHRLQKTIMALPTDRYLTICGILYCCKIVSTSNDDELCADLLTVASNTFGLTSQFTGWWHAMLAYQSDREQFLNLILVGVNEAINQFLGLPALTNPQLADPQHPRVKWEGLALIISDQHNVTSSDAGFQQFADDVL